LGARRPPGRRRAVAGREGGLAVVGPRDAVVDGTVALRPGRVGPEVGQAAPDGDAHADRLRPSRAYLRALREIESLGHRDWTGGAHRLARLVTEARVEADGGVVAVVRLAHEPVPAQQARDAL